MASPRQNPLTWNVRVVNPDGTPTKEFMQKWEVQARINGGIPALSTGPEVSAVLDVLGSTPNNVLIRGSAYWEEHPVSYALDKVGSTRGDILVRKTGAWDRLASPADSAKFLTGTTDPSYSNVHDSDLSLSDITTNNVSTGAHGFAPKLPNDASKYMDGTGAYSVPPGTSAAGMPLDYSFCSPGDGYTANSAAYCFKGLRFIPRTNMTIAGLWFALTPTVAAIYQGFLAPLSSGTSSSPTLTSAPTFTNTYTGINTNLVWEYLPFSSPVTLTSGTVYVLMVGITSATSTTSIPLSYTANANILLPQQIEFPGTAYGRISKLVPANGDTIDFSGGSADRSMSIGFRRTA